LRSLSADPQFKDDVQEKTWKASEGLSGCADLTFRRGWTPRLALSAQLSTTFMDVVLRRKEFYRAEGAALIWVCRVST
jgi:hypothetical protein